MIRIMIALMAAAIVSVASFETHALSGLVTGGARGGPDDWTFPDSFPGPFGEIERLAFDLRWAFPIDALGMDRRFEFDSGDGALLTLQLGGWQTYVYGSEPSASVSLASDSFWITLDATGDEHAIRIFAEMTALPMGVARASFEMWINSEGYDVFPIFEEGCDTSLACLPFGDTEFSRYLDTSAYFEGTTTAGEAFEFWCPGDGSCGRADFVEPIPEPTGALLFGLGLLALRPRNRQA